MSIVAQPITLQGEHVRLEPLAMRHASDLFACGLDPALWRFWVEKPFETLEDIQQWIGRAMEAPNELAFAIVHNDAGCAVGSTRYMDIRPADRGLEIGTTWIAVDYQRSAVNTECKLLLLRHAFEQLCAVRVQLKTDLRNEQSQRAIVRLGAVREGVLRRSCICHNGHQRDSVYYSILDSEWPAVKQRLMGSLERAPQQSLDTNTPHR